MGRAKSPRTPLTPDERDGIVLAVSSAFRKLKNLYAKSVAAWQGHDLTIHQVERFREWSFIATVMFPLAPGIGPEPHGDTSRRQTSGRRALGELVAPQFRNTHRLYAVSAWLPGAHVDPLPSLVVDGDPLEIGRRSGRRLCRRRARHRERESRTEQQPRLRRILEEGMATQRRARASRHKSTPILRA